jgi:hypothetical protein
VPVWNRAGSLILALSLSIASTVSSQEADRGRDDYIVNCASCHGDDGKGRGPLAARLKRRPSDLTAIARKNSGVFPTTKVYQQIDGRTAPHGQSDMPVWGCRHAPAPSVTGRKTFRPRPTESLLDLSCDPEPVIRQRILSILGYLSRIQER